MKLYDITLVAGVAETITAPGNFIHALNAAGPFTVKPYNSGERLHFVPGVGLSIADGFNILEIESDTDQEIDLYVGYGSVVDSRAGMVGARSTGLFEALTDVTIGATVSGLIAPASGSRSEILIQSDGSNAGDVRLGGSLVDGAGGLKLSPGGQIVLTTGAAIYGFNTGATSATLYLSEVG